MLLLKTMSCEGLRGDPQDLPTGRSCRGQQYLPAAGLRTRLARTIDHARSVSYTHLTLPTNREV